MDRNRILVAGGLVLALLAGVSIYYLAFAPGEHPVATTPNADLDFEYHPANDSVTVIHSKGETIGPQETNALEVYVFPTNETRPDSPRTTIPLPFTEGETATISNVTENDRVVVLWRGDSKSHTLGNYSVRSGERR